MIKKFEEFVAECYNKPVSARVNEAFQSSKLRDIIKKHGLPEFNCDKKMLYDLQDDEIIDVLDNRKEYYEKYFSEKPGEQATFMIELEDGAVVVIGNLDIFNKYVSDIEKEKQKDIDDIFKKRHSKRHVGNLGKGGDDIHDKHMKNVDKIQRRRFAEKLQTFIPEIVDAVKSIMDNIDLRDIYEGNEGYIESEITLDGKEEMIYVNYESSYTTSKREYGVETDDISYELTSFEICGEIDDYDGVVITNEELGVTNETHKELFKEYKFEHESVYDPYQAYGVW